MASQLLRVVGLVALSLVTANVAVANGYTLNSNTAEGDKRGLFIDVPVLETTGLAEFKVDALNVEHDLTASAASSNPAPLQFAAPISTDASLHNGVWDSPSPDIARWRLRVKSPAAASVSAVFTNLWLPPSAEITFSRLDGMQTHGPFGATYNVQQELWLPLINADEAIIELSVLASEADQVQFQLSRINHGYKSTNASNTIGSCNVDATCSAGAGYSAQKRSVAKLVIDGAFACTGTLLNNTNNDGRPYILTARHCFEASQQGFDPNLDSTVTVTWNYESDSCGGAAATSSHTQSGTQLRATWDDTDMLLLELLSPPPDAYEVYYAGWNRADSNFTGTASLHHPNAAARMISVDDDQTVITGEFSNGQGNSTYYRVSWEQGTTEGGSSGAALFSSSGKQVVGQLLGGNASCDFPDGFDWFGRINKSWYGGGGECSSLKYWLDPQGGDPLGLTGRDYDQVMFDSANPQPEAMDCSIITNNNLENDPRTGSAEDESEQNGGGGASGLHLLLLLLSMLAIARYKI